jgi:hypothetical protein
VRYRLASIANAIRGEGVYALQRIDHPIYKRKTDPDRPGNLSDGAERVRLEEFSIMFIQSR